MKYIKFLSPQFIAFCIVGASGVIVNEGILFILTEYFGLFYLLSSIFAIIISINTNFILNDLWTFRRLRKRSNKSYFGRLISWNCARILTAIINFLILAGLTSIGLHYLISNLIGVVVATGLAYFLSIKYVWKQRL